MARRLSSSLSGSWTATRSRNVAMGEATTALPRGRLVERIIGALLLDRHVYAEVSATPTANGQAFAVVLLSGLCNGLGLTWRMGGFGISVGVGASLLSWFVWTAVIFTVAALLGQRDRSRSLLRALGFANAPAMVLLFGFVPLVGDLIRVVVVCWLLAAAVVAIEGVFEISRRRAIVIASIGFVLYLFLGAWLAYYAS